MHALLSFTFGKETAEKQHNAIMFVIYSIYEPYHSSYIFVISVACLNISIYTKVCFKFVKKILLIDKI